MIYEIMDPKYLATMKPILAEQVKSVASEAERNDPDLIALMKKEEVDLSDLESAVEKTAEAASVAVPKDEATIFPRDAASSFAQSVAQRYFLDRHLVRTRAGAGAGNVIHPISDLTLAPDARTPAKAKLFGKMSQSDVRWVACLAAKMYRKFAKRRPFPDKPAPVCDIAADARIFLVGDWGSGVSRARKIADRIRSMLDETNREQHVIHLGDVYYSGWPEEYEDHFLANWPVKAGEENKYGSWCLNANHDMFAGGHGYFDHLLLDARFARQRFQPKGGTSFFALRHEHWLIAGLDSAWTDGDLAGGQVEWIEALHKKNPSKNLILMTHHQPISAFEKEYSKLQVLLKRTRPRAWFWGHEHRFAMYNERPDLPYGRLIGHGGVPVWQKKWPAEIHAKVEYVGELGFAGGIGEHFALFGFAVLDFEGQQIKIRYFDERGEIERSETMMPWPSS